MTRTFLTDVVGLEVGEEVLLTGLQQVHGIVRYGDSTMATPGASSVEMLKHIRPASDFVLRGETLATRVDAPVARLDDHDDRVRGAAGVERVWKAVLSELCVSVHTTRYNEFTTNSPQQMTLFDKAIFALW